MNTKLILEILGGVVGLIIIVYGFLRWFAKDYENYSD